MVHQPMLQPDPSERPRAPDLQSPSQKRGPEWFEGDSETYLADLAATLASHGGGESSADLALDLLLNQIVEEARSATNASGAALALARKGEMVCRATTGENAPDLSVRLNTNAGLSGACIQSQEVQRCDDTEADARVDAEACRRLQVRSILVVPVLDGNELRGIFEILSARPNAFDDRDARTLRALSWRVVDSIHHAEASAPSKPSATQAQSRGEVYVPRFLETQSTQTRRRDYWTGILATAVVCLAAFLAWFVGRAGWQTAIDLATAQPAESAPPTTVAASTASSEKTPSANPKSGVHPPSRRSQNKAGGSAGPSTSKPDTETSAPEPGGLVVYEKGKVIFQIPATDKSEPTAASSVQPASKRESDAGFTRKPVLLPEEMSSAYLIRRIEPEYPEQARKEHITGLVVLKATVGSDGTVREVTDLSGDQQLVAAAADAVRQWRFKPYRANGQPVPFETRVTFDFTLP